MLQIKAVLFHKVIVAILIFKACCLVDPGNSSFEFLYQIKPQKTKKIF